MILVRHGQSEFNVIFNRTGKDPGIRDPRLTPHGRDQAAATAKSLSGGNYQRIVVSPYTRTLETAHIMAEALRLPLEVDPLVREHALYHCDIGTPRKHLQEAWPTLDFDHLEEIWWPNLDETEAQLRDRARSFQARASNWDDWRHVVVVSHWGFVLRLTGKELRNGEYVAFDPTLPPE